MPIATLVFAMAFGVMAMGQYDGGDDDGDAASREFHCVVSEEQPVGSVVAELVSEARLRQSLDSAVVDALVFSVFHGPYSQLFAVDSPSGTVRVKRVVDRDVICHKQPTCIIPLDVAIIRPSAYFRVSSAFHPFGVDK